MKATDDLMRKLTKQFPIGQCHSCHDKVPELTYEVKSDTDAGPFVNGDHSITWMAGRRTVYLNFKISCACGHELSQKNVTSNSGHVQYIFARLVNAWNTPFVIPAGPMKGAALITEERKKSLPLRVYDIKNNSEGQLREAAIKLLQGYQFSPDGTVKELTPSGWSSDRFLKMMRTTYFERLITAGALVAAEIDRVASTDKDRIPVSHYDPAVHPARVMAVTSSGAVMKVDYRTDKKSFWVGNQCLEDVTHFKLIKKE